jgi:methionine-rich copper-binding protein CopC
MICFCWSPEIRKTVMAFLRMSVVGATALLLAGTGVALAHASLMRAAPPAGSTVKRPPSEASLSFSEALEPAFSRIEVRDAAGHRVDKDDSRVAPDNPKRLTVSLTPLGPGTYKVVWRVLSVDTHTTNGEYLFTIAP